MGFSSVTGLETFMHTDNMSFDGTSRGGGLTQDGEMYIGSAVLPRIRHSVPTGSNGIVITPGAGTLNISGSGTFAQQQIYYVGKHGNNANAGTNIDTAVLTFGQALTLATAAVPSAVNRFAIVCVDDGIYTEDIAGVQYVDIYAPNATIVTTAIGLLVSDDANYTFSAFQVPTGSTGIAKIAGTGIAHVSVDTVTCAGTGQGFANISGVLMAKWKTLSVVDGFGVGDITTAQDHTHVDGGDIYISGTGFGLGRNNTGSTVGNINHILNEGAGTGIALVNLAGTLDLNVQTIATTTSVLLDDSGGGAGTVFLKLFVNQMTGVRSIVGTPSFKYWTPADAMTNGQLVIGSTGVDPVVATLTAGTGIGITNAAGSITINGTGGGLTWTTQSASTALLVNRGFICTAGAALSFSLPATSAVGDVIGLTLDGSTSWTVTQGAGQQIRIGNVQTTAGAGGSLASTAAGDTIIMVCSVANTKWNVYSEIGNITVV